MFLELTFLRVAWTFNFDFAHYEMAGVIWAIGWCMIILAGLSRLSAGALGVAGVLIIAGHNLFDPSFGPLLDSLGTDLGSALWKIAYVGFWAGPISGGPDGPNLVVLYSIIPWIGVMMAGFGFGRVLTAEPGRRDRLCLAIGLGAVAAFLALRGFNLYGDPRPWSAPTGEGGMPAIFSFLNTTKYPASLSFLLMTLGPAVALMPLAGRMRGPLAGAVAIFGRVPFFFYVVHIPLIHAAAMAVSFLTTGTVDGWLFTNHPMGNPPPPDGYAWSLATLYLVWAAVIALLYVACRWFAALKSARTEWWLKYL